MKLPRILFLPLLFLLAACQAQPLPASLMMADHKVYAQLHESAFLKHKIWVGDVTYGGNNGNTAPAFQFAREALSDSLAIGSYRADGQNAPYTLSAIIMDVEFPRCFFGTCESGSTIKYTLSETKTEKVVYSDMLVVPIRAIIICSCMMMPLRNEVYGRRRGRELRAPDACAGPAQENGPVIPMKNASLCVLLLLCACAKDPSQNQYKYNEVGQSVVIEFARIVSVREVDITGRNTGTGALLGGAAGAGAGAYAGNGSGTGWAMAGGAVAGAVAGLAAEQALADRKGYEYIVVTENKKTKSIANQDKRDVVFKPGDRVGAVTRGTYQRLLPADNLPDEVKAPKGIKIVD